MSMPAAVTKGGLLQNPLVARYVASLGARPLLTKCYTSGNPFLPPCFPSPVFSIRHASATEHIIYLGYLFFLTSGILSFLQEVLACHVAGVKFRTPKNAPAYAHILAALKVDARALKMAIYGFFVSAPLGHYINLLMLKTFAGRTSKTAKLGQLVAQNFVVAPIHTFVYLASMAVIGGAKTKDEVMTRVNRGFGKMLALTWLVNPTALLIAQKVVPLELWTMFFSLINFSIGTFFNTKVKQLQVMASDRDRKRQDGRAE